MTATWAEHAARLFEAPRDVDLAAWVADKLGEHLWSKQREVADSVHEHRRTAVKSCHSAGKSHLASRIALHWIDSHPPGEAFVVTTAPTYAQVRAILWRYIRQGHRKGQLVGRVNQTEWHYDDQLVAFGRKPSDTDEAAFQGIHARFVLVILDEAGGIPEQLWVAADALTTNPECRILAIGNPDNPSSHFRKVCDSGLWNVIRIAAADTPNLSGEDVPSALRRLLISAEWVEEKAREWGTDSPLYLSKVEGDFPGDDPHSVIRASDLAACAATREPSPDDGPVELGCDIGGGGDETVIRERRGMVAGREWRNRHDRPEPVADSIITAIRETGASVVKLDAGGIGWGVAGLVRDRLKAESLTCEVVPVHFGASPSDGKKFLNLRAEMWWTGRELAEAGARHLENPGHTGWDLSAAANVGVTCAQLAEPRWDLDPKGRIRVEPKDDVTKRLGRSPDNADALLLAFYTPPGALSANAWAAFYRTRVKGGDDAPVPHDV